MLKKQKSLDSIYHTRDSILEYKEELLKSSDSVLKFPRIDRHINKTTMSHHKNQGKQTLDQKENDTFQVSKLDQWTFNKPTKKSKAQLNTHNISFLYKSSSVIKQKARDFNQVNKFLDVQLYIAKIDNQLQKIGQINYFSIYKNFEYCCGVYENCFNTLLRTLAKHKTTVQAEVDQIQLKLQIDRQEHIKKVHQLQENSNQDYKVHMNEVRELLQQKEMNIKPLKRLLQRIDTSKIKVLKYCLALGYDVRQEGLGWILKELGTLPKQEEFPSYLSGKQINFILTRHTNEYEVSHAENQMKTQICGKTINEAYEHVNRRKRRELSFIKQSEELAKLYTNRIKDYTKEKHNYLYDETLQIAQQLQKEKPKPTRYEIIYKEAAKKLNKICKQKIHPQIYGKANKQNKRTSNEEQKTSKQQQMDPSSIKRKQKRKSTLIIEEFSQMLNLSITQSKKLDELYTKEEKQFQQILREIRNQKYNQGTNRRGSITKFDQLNEDQKKLRNPISILGCLVGCKKAQKIIEQQTF